jgi:uncharacterized protein YllA (UPF0747 family)
MTAPDSYRVPLDRYPGFNRFVLDWLGGDERFLPRFAMPRQTRSIAPELVNAIVDSNRRWGVFAREDVARWARGESVTLVAGQQVGFAGGPIYTLAKIASLVKMKRALEASGTPATVFFWLATEDHDFDEVATLNVPVATLPHDRDVNRQLDLLCMRAIRAGDGHAAVGSLPVPSGLATQLLALFDIDRPSWLREGVNFRDSFAELIATVFGKEVVLIDALLPELRRAGAPIFDQITRRRDEIQSALKTRGAELKAASYTEQVVPSENGEYTLLFELDEHGNRLPAAGRQLLPEQTSTSALTRPLLQDFVLRPDVFLGGPAEVAYYAQLAPLHDMLGIPMPRVALRGHALLASKRTTRLLGRYGIEPHEVFTNADAILAEREPEGVARVHSIADEARAELLKRIAELGELALPADHSLARAFAKSTGHIEYHFNKLTERAIKGLVRKDKERHAAVRELVSTLFPDRHVQDRVVSWFPYWMRYESHLIERLIEEIEPDTAAFAVVGL